MEEEFHVNDPLLIGCVCGADIKLCPGKYKEMSEAEKKAVGLGEIGRAFRCRKCGRVAIGFSRGACMNFVCAKSGLYPLECPRPVVHAERWGSWRQFREQARKKAVRACCEAVRSCLKGHNGNEALVRAVYDLLKEVNFQLCDESQRVGLDRQEHAEHIKECPVCFLLESWSRALTARMVPDARMVFGAAEKIEYEVCIRA